MEEVVHVKIILDEMFTLVTGDRYKGLERFDYVNEEPCRFKIKMLKGYWLMEIPEHKISLKILIPYGKSLKIEDVKPIVCKLSSMVNEVKKKLGWTVENLPKDPVLFDLQERLEVFDNVGGVLNQIIYITTQGSSSLEQTTVLKKEIYEKLKPGFYLAINKFIINLIEVGHSNILKIKFFPLYKCYMMLLNDTDINPLNFEERLKPVFSVGEYLLNLDDDTFESLKAILTIKSI